MSDLPRELRPLSEIESLRLLGSVSLGRVVYIQAGLPEIRPVNHLVDAGQIIIRSHLGAAVVTAADDVRGTPVSYEADELDPVQHLGWSVIVAGTARIVRAPDQIAHYQQHLQPWVTREMDYIVAIRPTLVTGRQLMESTARQGLRTAGPSRQS
jgi:hypothetical protein